MRNDLAGLLHEYIINLPPGLLQRDIHPFLEWFCTGEKGISRSFRY